VDLHIPYHIVKQAAVDDTRGVLLATVALLIMSRPEVPVIYVNAVGLQVALWGDVCDSPTKNDTRRTALRDGLQWLEREGLITVKRVNGNGSWIIDCSRLQMYDASLEVHCETWSPEREARYVRIIDADPEKYGNFGTTPASGPYWRTANNDLVIHRFVTITYEEFKIIQSKCKLLESERVLRYFLYLLSTTYASPESKRGVGYLSMKEQSFEFGRTMNSVRKYRTQLEDMGLIWVYRSDTFEERIKETAKKGHTGNASVGKLERDLVVCPAFAYGRAKDQKRINNYGRFIESPNYTLEVGEGYHPMKRDTERIAKSAFQKHIHWMQGKNYREAELREIYFTLYLDNTTRSVEKKRDLTEYSRYSFYLGESPTVGMLRIVEVDPSTNLADAVARLTSWWYDETDAGQKAAKKEAYFEWDSVKKKDRPKLR
jgi:hypothetical protein